MPNISKHSTYILQPFRSLHHSLLHSTRPPLHHTHMQSHMHTHTQLHTHTHLHMHSDTHVHTHPTHGYTHMDSHTRTRMHLHTCSRTSTHTCTCALTHVHTQGIDTHVHSHTCTHRGTHTHAHSHTCTYVHTDLQLTQVGTLQWNAKRSQNPQRELQGYKTKSNINTLGVFSSTSSHQMLVKKEIQPLLFKGIFTEELFTIRRSRCAHVFQKRWD